MPGRRQLSRLALLWLAGADLRLSMLAVPPVLPLIHRDLGLSEKAIGALSGLPILLLGLAAIPGSLLIARLGARRACIAGLLVVAAASTLRGAGASAPVLFAATFMIGVGVAVLQPALPSLVGAWFAQSPGFATAIYTNGLLIGESAPAALTIPLILPLVGGSWEWSFVVWAAPVAATALFVALTPADPPRRLQIERARWWPDWRSARVWQLGVMLGCTGGLYFATNAFIPDYLHAIGRPELVGASLAALNLGQLPASAIILLWARRLTGNKTAFVTMPLLAFLGIAAVLDQHAAMIVCGAGVIGFCAAFVLILSLALPPLLAPPADVHRLSAGMFAIGYSISCLAPLLGGAIWDASRVPASCFAAAAISAAGVLAAALTLPRSSGLRTARAG